MSWREGKRRLHRRIANRLRRWFGKPAVCERCGCSLHRPCTVEADGLPCHWSWELWTRGRFVCTACEPPAEPGV